MKIFLLVTASTAFFCVLFLNEMNAQTPQPASMGVEIVRIKAQEFSRSLAQLKIEEVALERASPADAKALSLNRAQQDALEQELVNLAVGPLIAERDRCARDLRPEHPKMIALNAEIEKAKASITGGK